MKPLHLITLLFVMAPILVSASLDFLNDEEPVMNQTKINFISTSLSEKVEKSGNFMFLLFIFRLYE
jgi:hypothetical protein